uniref:Putative secreted protein n=1 Tax=Ixodes scapularis TaxID=6945 RepID=A0A4D5S7N7_IXOSC
MRAVLQSLFALLTPSENSGCSSASFHLSLDSSERLSKENKYFSVYSRLFATSPPSSVDLFFSFFLFFLKVNGRKLWAQVDKQSRLLKSGSPLSTKHHRIRS